MQILENISLKPFNTFGVDVQANKFVEVESVEDLKKVLPTNEFPLLILGGGSNLLLTKDFEGLVVKNNIKGIAVDESGNDVFLKVGAGENWHQFVLYCLENGYCGVENLSLIPGNVGASPMQNIGAYGVEVKDLIVEVEAMNLTDFSLRTFDNTSCEFGYRTSIFKTSERGNYLITSVTFKLSKVPNINTGYGAIKDELERLGVNNPTIKDVSRAVINIRESKLPDPNKIGNSGSFFKNPVVSEELKNKIMARHADLPNYPQPDGSYKIAAGWLIEQCGWKGKMLGNYGVHDKQALVLVNHGGASGLEIFDLSAQIISSVEEKFKISLEREVNII